MEERRETLAHFSQYSSYFQNIALKYFLSSCSACVAETITYPLDLTKTRLQIHGETAADIPKRGMVQTVALIVREEGPLKLFQGLTPALYRHIIYTGVRMAMYEAMRDIGHQDGPTPLWRRVVQGAIAGGFAQFLASPMDLVKVQIQLEGQRRLQGLPPRLHGVGQAFRVQLKEAGLFGLWRGCIPNVQRAMLVNMGDLATYDGAKHYIIRNTTFFKDDMLTHFVASCMSSFVAACLSVPADVVKTRVMNQPLDSSGRGLYYRGSIDCLVKTVSGEGVSALLKGFLPMWARMAPWSLTFWLTYEQLRRLCGAGGF